MNVASNDLMKDDLIPFIHPDDTFDLLIIGCVEWQEDQVMVTGLSARFGMSAVAYAPFNQLVEVWNA
jgi:hypothetical protein